MIVDVQKLSVSILMVGTFTGFAIGLQAVLHVIQKKSYCIGRNIDFFVFQFVCELSNALAGPTEWRFRITTHQRINQGIKLFINVGINRFGIFSSSSLETGA
jgi:hypothetical protein